ncbi:MAG: hypothetical protein M3P06_17525 [Acidobacteriota bacterium]|nr:hypothetical protein [Acidobacteriota bacterium]
MADIKDAYLSEWALKECWAEEEQGIHAAINALDEGLPEYRYAYVKVLGVGGSGVVLRLKDSVFPEMDNALKFPRPVPGKVSFLSEMLTKEIQFLAELRHPGIIRILYHKVLSHVDIYRNLPFYLMEAIDGTRSDVYVRQLQATALKERTEEAQQRFEDDLLRLFINVLDSVQYLHHHPSGPRVHLDIKPENIVVTSTGQPVMIDLGTCKRVLLDKNSTIVACTLSMAAPSLARLLADDPSDANRAGGEIARDKILLSWDLWAFAVSIFRWLGIEHDNGELRKDAAADLLSAYSRKYLILLAARFMANEKIEDMPSWIQQRIGLSKVLLRAMAITSSKEGIDLFERLRGASNPLAAIPELASRAVTTIQPSAGLHVALTPRLTNLLEHRALRRLDSIAQLGMVVEVYPEARHTRKEHSLGTYAWTIQYLHALYSDPVSPLFKQWITESDCRDVLLAAIFHDIGHFPLAHDLEDIDGDLFNHADMTAAWLKGTFRKAPGGKLDFESLDTELDNWNSTADRILAILGAKANSSSQSILPKAKLLLSLISGPIDADKIDYLLRDADRMHLPYPLGIDVDRILKSLTTVVIDKVQSGARDVPVIGVHAKGKIAAEFVSIARYAMFSQGYWHHTVRAMKAMLARAVRALTAEATDEARSRFQFDFVRFAFSLPEAIFRNADNQRPLFSKGSEPNPIPDTKGTEVPQLAVTDVVTLRWLEQRLVEQERSEASLLEGILSRTLYKRLWVVSRDMQRDHWDEIVRLWTALRRQKKQQLAGVFEKNVSSKLFERGVTAITATKLGGNPTSPLSGAGARQVIEINVASKVPWLLIDIPESRPGAEVGLYYVLEGQRRQLRKDDKVTGSIQESEVWTQYASNLLQAAGKIRIFCDPRLVDAVDASIAWEEGIELLTNSLVALKS